MQRTEIDTKNSDTLAELALPVKPEASAQTEITKEVKLAGTSPSPSQDLTSSNFSFATERRSSNLTPSHEIASRLTRSIEVSTSLNTEAETEVAQKSGKLSTSKPREMNPFAGKTILDKLVNFVAYLLKRLEQFIFRQKEFVMPRRAPRVVLPTEEDRDQNAELKASVLKKAKAKRERWTRWSR